jgi:hypothetical protein
MEFVQVNGQRLRRGDCSRIQQAPPRKTLSHRHRQRFEPAVHLRRWSVANHATCGESFQPSAEFAGGPLIREARQAAHDFEMIFEFDVPLGGQLRFAVSVFVLLPTDSHGLPTFRLPVFLCPLYYAEVEVLKQDVQCIDRQT